MLARDEILSQLKKVIDKKVNLEHPENPEHGDFSTNVAMQMGEKPLEKAKEISEKLNRNKEIKKLVEKVEVAPPGFINFWLSKEALVLELATAQKTGEKYGQSETKKGEKLLVEFAHPNTHKLFHIGHLRNITLGESICRLLISQGAKTTRVNYQGDVGLHIAKALWGLQKIGVRRPKSLDEKVKLLSQGYVEGNKAYGSEQKAKAEIEELNKKLYEGDKELTKLWQETRGWSLEYFDRIYERVGAKFERLYFESEVAEPGKKIVLENVGKIFLKDEGAIIFPGEKYGLHNRVFINKFGFSTYEGKDIGLAHLQFKEFSPDLIIHVVGPEQKGYFEVVFKALGMVNPKFLGKEYHLEYGWVRLKAGKMSSRTGEVVEGEWLLDEAKRRLESKYKMPGGVAEQVAVAAVKYSLLKLAPRSEIAFDIEESINLEGDSGPYLQYTFARCQSVLRKAGRRVLPLASPRAIPPANKLGAPSLGLPGSRHPSPEELAILRTFYKFPEIVTEAAGQFAPNLLCGFLFELAQKYNAFYNKHRILDSNDNQQQTTKFRLALTLVTGNILKSGLNLLGIEAPEKM